MKILIVSSGYPDKENRVKKIFAHEQNLEFIKQGCQLEVINLSSKSTIYTPVYYEKVPVYSFIKITSFIDLIKIKFQIRKFLFDKEYDLVLLNGLAIYQYFIFGELKFKCKAIAVIVHGTDAMISKSIIKNILRRSILQKVDYIFPVSQYTDTLVSHLEGRTNSSAVKSIIVPNGVNEEKFLSIKNKSKIEIRNELGLPSNSFIILTVSDLIERKGVDILIRALNEFHKTNSNYLHIVIGRGDQKESLISQATNLGIIGNVKFIDYIKEDSLLVKYYRASDVYCMVSKTLYQPPNCEGFGISYIEASYLGIPVIGGNNGGSTTAIQHNFTGYLVDPYAQDAHVEIKDHLKTLNTNISEYNRLSSNGKYMIQKEFTWESNVSRILKILKANDFRRQ